MLSPKKVKFRKQQKGRMKGLQAPPWMTISAWIIAIVVIVLNIKLIYDVATGAVAL